MNMNPFFNVATPGVAIVMFAGGIIVLILVTLLISLVETVILTLSGWAEFKRSLGICILMNTISGILGGILLIFIPQPSVEGLAMAMLLSILVEGVVMLRSKMNKFRPTLIAVTLANLISYALVIFPAYYFSLK